MLLMCHWRLSVCLYLCTWADVSIKVCARIRWSAFIFGAVWTETATERKLDTLTDMHSISHPRNRRLLEALMWTYYAHNHSQIHHILPMFFHRLLFSFPAIHRSPSTSPRHHLSALLVFPLYQIAMINLWDIHPVGFLQNQWLFWSITFQDKRLCACWDVCDMSR